MREAKVSFVSDCELQVKYLVAQSFLFSHFFDADWADEVVAWKFLKPWDKPVDWRGETEFFFRYERCCNDG